MRDHTITYSIDDEVLKLFGIFRTSVPLFGFGNVVWIVRRVGIEANGRKSST
jgi:hypothetical protein